MSKLRQIEAAIQQTDQATFQRLGDAYLRRRGYDRLNPIGLALGRDKTTTGTPDSLIEREDGKYVFVEYTTERTGLWAKFRRDIQKCLNARKTGIPVAQIAEIVLCYGSKLSARAETSLRKMCRGRGVTLTAITPGYLAHELYSRYPGLARDFLGVEVDTGQILPPTQFVDAYDRVALAAPLNTTLRFREAEMERIGLALEQSNVVLITGRPGVGKSRLAVECARAYGGQHSDVQVQCVLNRGVDLYQDLRDHFTAPGHYLVMVDDANRVMHFDYVVELLRDSTQDRVVKVLATVRDYALEGVATSARAFGVADPIRIEGLAREQIRELVKSDFGILNPLYQDRIADIAQGNPRLAVMAARVAIKNDTLMSIADASSLYDEYFSSIRADIAELDDPTLLLVAALVAFFRIIDRSHSEFMGVIEDVFGYDRAVIWRAVHRLHALEALDLYEDGIARVSDQILATYLFYLAAFKTRTLDLGVLFAEFFPRFRARFIDALTPVVGVFGNAVVREGLREPVTRAKTLFDQRDDADALLHLLDVFWFVLPLEALVYVNEAIANLDPDAASDVAPSFAPSKSMVPAPSLLSILSRFGHAALVDRGMAVNLLVDYLERCPSDAPIVVRLLNESFGIDHHVVHLGFDGPINTAETLITRADAGRSLVASRLFLAFAQGQLRTRFHTSEPQNGGSVTFFDFRLPLSKGAIALREVLWQEVFRLYAIPDLRDDVVSLLAAYVRSGLDTASREIVAAESSMIQMFMGSQLDPVAFRHCVVAREYVDALDRLSLPHDDAISRRFVGDTYSAWALLSIDHGKCAKLGWERYQLQREADLSAFAGQLDSGRLREFLTNAVHIRGLAEAAHSDYDISSGVVSILSTVARRDASLFASTLDDHLHTGNALRLEPVPLVVEFIAALGPDVAFERLAAGEYSGQATWMSGYFAKLPTDAITAARAVALVELYQHGPLGQIIRDLEYLVRFDVVRPGIVREIIRLLVDRSRTDRGGARLLSGLFEPPLMSWEQTKQFMTADPGLLREAFLIACGVTEHLDPSGVAFNELLSVDPDFGVAWCAWLCERPERLGWHADDRDYTILWRRPDAESAIQRLIDPMLAQPSELHGMGPFPNVFFRIRPGAADADVLMRRQDTILNRLIAEHHRNQHTMQLVFGVASEFSQERRRAHIAALLTHRPNLESFQHLPLEPTHEGWSGSAVPMYRRRVEFLESLLPLMEHVSLLGHRAFITQRIQEWHNEIERAKRRDFMDS